MAVDYEDKRLTDIEAAGQKALEETGQTYDNMIDQSDGFYQAQIDASKQWEEKQSQLQQERTDFAIEQIDQQKNQAQKDYTKEQSASYVDWQKQSNQYGANAEAMAAQGMRNTGYSESAQVSMYNTYQNRVATAKASFDQAVLGYNNAINEAILQNNAALAEIAYNAMQEQLALALEGFQYKNSLLQQKMSAQQSIQAQYYNQYMDMLGQINTENSLAEQIRQFNESLAEDQRQYDLDYQLDQDKLAESKRQYDTSLAEDQRQFDVKYGQAQQETGEAGLTINGDGETGTTVTNEETDNGLIVGGKEVSWVDLLEGVENGTYIEKTDANGNVTYEYVGAGNTSNKSTEAGSAVKKAITSYAKSAAVDALASILGPAVTTPIKTAEVIKTAKEIKKLLQDGSMATKSAGGAATGGVLHGGAGGKF